MNDVRFKKGDKVKCSWFLYGQGIRYKDMVGIFNHYNKYEDAIAYIDFGQSGKGFDNNICCFTKCIELSPKRNEQLLFDFMLKKG